VSGRLHERQRAEQRETVSQQAVLAVVRLVIRSGVGQLDAAAACTAAAVELDRIADAHARAAVAEGESYAAVARAVGVSRQAATKRYGRSSSA
jgi:uncharacterized membrane protein YqiK